MRINLNLFRKIDLMLNSIKNGALFLCGNGGSMCMLCILLKNFQDTLIKKEKHYLQYVFLIHHILHVLPMIQALTSFFQDI